MKKFAGCVLLVVAVLWGGAAAMAAEFEVRIDPSVRDRAYTGRIYVVLTPDGEQRPPRLRMNDWFNPPTIFSLDVAGVAPGGTVIVDSADPKVIRYDGDRLLDEAGNPKAGRSVRAQAIARVNPDTCKPGLGEGDLASAVSMLDPGAETLSLNLEHEVTAKGIEETDRVRLVEMISPSLSAFHGRDVRMRAAVQLPEGWSDADTEPRPVVVMIGGFGGGAGDIAWAGPLVRNSANSPMAERCLVVVPDAENFHGHSVFADSDVTGPWGRMLCDELLPEVDRRFGGAGPDFRYVTGISSGGWASLWLLVSRPDAFRACFSHVPDPVDFHDFQQIDLYADDANIYRNASGERRPIARRGDTPILYYDDFVARERALGPGGQIHSFEAVFGPSASGGGATPMFDRETGDVDPDVIEHWKRYDVRRVVEENWTSLKPELNGNVYVWAGGADNFYLEGAVERLGETMDRLGADTVVEIVPDMPHTFFMPGFEAMFDRIEKDWVARDAGVSSEAKPATR